MQPPGLPALRRHHLVFLVLILLFLIVFFFYPLAAVMQGGLQNSERHFSVAPLFKMLTDSYYQRIILFTLTQALLSTVLAVLLGLPGAYLLARFHFKGKRLVRALTTIPFVLPSILVVLGFVLFFGNNGILNRGLMALLRLREPPLRILYSLKAILLAHAFYNFPICIRIVSGLWSRVNPHLEEAARSLGARGWRLFRRVTLPQILPGVLASAALIFIFCFMSFAIVLVLGGGPRYATLEVEVYRLAKIGLDLDAASRLALIGSALTLLLLYGYIKLQQRAGFAAFADDELSRLVRVASEEWREAASLHTVRHVEPEKVEHGWHNIHQFNEMRTSGVRGDVSRPRYHQRNPDDAVVETVDLVDHTVLAHELAVVGGVDDNGVLAQPQTVERLDHPAETVIDVVLHAVPQRYRLAEILLGDLFHPHHSPGHTLVLGFALQRIERRHVDVFGTVHRCVRFGCLERRVRFRI